MRVLNEATRVARKDHTCGLCLCPIRKGDRYEDQTNDGDGEGVAHFRTHPECFPMARAWGLELDGAYEWECLRIFVLESIAEIGTDRMLRGLPSDWAARVLAIAEADRG